MGNIRKMFKSSFDRKLSRDIDKSGKSPRYNLKAFGEVCRLDVTTDELLRCLAKSMRPHKGEMVVCVPGKELRRKDITLRTAASRLGVKLAIRRKIISDGIDDAVCFVLSEEDRNKLMGSQ